MKDKDAPKQHVEGERQEPAKPASAGDEEIQNPHPLSEKDEVKEAERRMRDREKK